jgi:hypothetical protein
MCARSFSRRTPRDCWACAVAEPRPAEPVVSKKIELTLDIEAILGADLEATDAIDYHRAADPG